PFWGEFRADGVNTSAPLGGIFRLIQSSENCVEPIRSSALLKSLLPCVLFFSADTGDHKRLLGILAAASAEIPGYSLRFRKDRSFWDVLPSCTCPLPACVERILRCPGGRLMRRPSSFPPVKA